jgi:hypothetical protein
MLRRPSGARRGTMNQKIWRAIGIAFKIQQK